MRPSFAIHPPKNRGRRRPSREGAGKAGCPRHPQPVCSGRKHTVVTTGTHGSSGLPCTMVLTVSSVLSSATNSSCHRHRRINGVTKPGWARDTSADLTPATGVRTTRLRRTWQHRSSPHGWLAHRLDACPALTRATTLPRPPHPAPTFVTMANAPLPGRDSAIRAGDLASKGRNIFFAPRLDRANQIESLRQIRLLAHVRRRGFYTPHRSSERELSALSP
jgi:hypothetical protein